MSQSMLKDDLEYMAMVENVADEYSLSKDATNATLCKLGLQAFQCPYFEQDGVRGDQTIHIFTHFIQRKETAIRQYVHKYYTSRMDYFESVARLVLENLGISAKDYLDNMAKPAVPLDMLGIFLIACLYRFHVSVVLSDGIWSTSQNNDVKKSMFVLIFRGTHTLSETCKMEQYDVYLKSITEKTEAGLMPLHTQDIKMSLLETEEESKPKISVKKEFNISVGFSKPKNLSSLAKYSAAAKLVAKAKIEAIRSEIRQEKKVELTQMIQSRAYAGGHKMKRITCPYCSMDCRSQRRYVVHLKEDHPDITFSCTICAKEFQSWSGCYKHEKAHSASKVVCAICGRGFTYQNELNKHMATHDPARKVYCEDCGKGFASKANLKRHAQIHLDLQLPCSNCEKTFGTPEWLQRHFRGFHSPGYTTRCQKFTFKWPGKRQRHQNICTECKTLLQELQSHNYPSQRD